MTSPKYPRTPHLPYSPGGTSDDRRISSVKSFLGTPVVLTEKMDGSNVCLETHACFARSHASSPNHPSFDAFKACHAVVKNRIPAGIQVFGEWLFAKHSIAYNDLPSYFMAFGVRDINKGSWASWAEVELWADELGVPSVPVLARDLTFTSDRALQKAVEGFASQPSLLGEAREGIVIRLADEFPDALFEKSVAKWVRSNHVSCSDHWAHQTITRNGLVV